MRGFVLPTVLAAGMLVTGVAFGHEAGTAGPATLTAHDFWRYLHLVLLVFWLGPEVAIMVAGQHAADPALNPAQRAGAARMMQYYEIMPRVCMSLMLTVGGMLSEYVGLEHPAWQTAGIWLLGPVWLGLTLTAYFGAQSAAGGLAARLERWLRMLVVAAVPVSVGYSIATQRLAEAPYVGGKLLLFALAVALSLGVGRVLAPYRAGVAQLATGSISPALDAEMIASFRRGRRLLFGIWAALLIAALSGVVQPGVVEPARES